MTEEAVGDPAPVPETTSATELTLSRRDVLMVWKVIEKLVVSADRIAGAYEFGGDGVAGDGRIDLELQQEHDRAFAEYFRDLAPHLLEARNALLDVLDLDAEEAVHLTNNVIQYWRPDRPKIDYDGDELEGPDISLD